MREIQTPNARHQAEGEIDRRIARLHRLIEIRPEIEIPPDKTVWLQVVVGCDRQAASIHQVDIRTAYDSGHALHLFIGRENSRGIVRRLQRPLQ